MPIFSGNALGIGVSMDGKDLGMPLAKISAERLVAFHVKRLIAKEQDLMLRKRLMQLLDLAIAERIGERQAVDLGANAGRDRRDIDGFIAHGATFPCGKIDHIRLPVTGYLAENLFIPADWVPGPRGQERDHAYLYTNSADAYSTLTFATLMIGVQGNSPIARSCCS